MHLATGVVCPGACSPARTGAPGLVAALACGGGPGTSSPATLCVAAPAKAWPARAAILTSLQPTSGGTVAAPVVEPHSSMPALKRARHSPCQAAWPSAGKSAAQLNAGSASGIATPQPQSRSAASLAAHWAGSRSRCRLPNRSRALARGLAARGRSSSAAEEEEEDEVAQALLSLQQSHEQQRSPSAAAAAGASAPAPSAVGPLSQRPTSPDAQPGAAASHHALGLASPPQLQHQQHLQRASGAGGCAAGLPATAAKPARPGHFPHLQPTLLPARTPCLPEPRRSRTRGWSRWSECWRRWHSGPPKWPSRTWRLL